MIFMASIEQIKGSDGSGNASVATVQNARSPGASTIIVDTVLNINPVGFKGSMGTPHTFTDPITSETITVISEATCVDFTGHVDGSNIEIDSIAPGYTDLGSEVGDIIIIRPTTESANNVAEVLEEAHNDDGSLKDDAVTTDVIADDAVTTPKIDDAAVTGAKIDFADTGQGAVWWEELGRTTLGVAGDTITVNSIPARKYLRIIIITINSGAIQTVLRCNNDSGSNYSLRYEIDGSFSTTTSTSSLGNLSTGSDDCWSALDVINIAALQKMFLGRSMYGTSSAAVAPHNLTFEGLWNNTADQITRIDVLNIDSGSFDVGSEVIVLGHN